MQEIIKLDWQGPITLRKTDNVSLNIKNLDCCGVYAWVFPAPPYKIPGIYFGYSAKLSERVWKHYGELLSGHYFIPDRDKPDISNPEINPSENLNEYLSNIDRIWESANEAEIYYAVNPDLDAERFYDIERALIETMSGRHGQSDNGYFVANSGLRGCRAFSGTPLKIINSGASIVVDAVGAEIAYGVPHRALHNSLRPL